MLAVAAVAVVGVGAFAIRHLNSQPHNPNVDRQGEFEQIVNQLKNSNNWEDSHTAALNQLFDMDEDVQRNFFSDPARRTALQNMVSREHIKDYRVPNALEKFQPVSPSSSETMERGSIIVEPEAVQEAAAPQQAKNVEVVPPQSNNAQRPNNTGRSHYGSIICIDCCYYPASPYAMTPGAQYGRPYGSSYNSANPNNGNSINCCNEAASATVSCFNATLSLVRDCAGTTISTAEGCPGATLSAGECLINGVSSCITTTGGTCFNETSTVATTLTNVIPGCLTTTCETIGPCVSAIPDCMAGVGGLVCGILDLCK